MLCHSLLVVDDERSAERFLNDHLPRLDGKRVALDIEEDRVKRYLPHVALVQATYDNFDYIFDPITLAPELFVPIIEQLCHATDSVVLHAAQNDVRGLKRDFGFGPRPIHDTEIMARFLGIRSFGLASILSKTMGVTLDKSERMSDWAQRPLTNDQLRYARNDTAYLIELDDSLRAQVESSGWMDAVIEEEAATSNLDAESIEFNPLGWKKIKKIGSLDSSGQERLSALWNWRDTKASEYDLHAQIICPNWALRELAVRRHFPSTSSRVYGALEPLVREELGDLWSQIISDFVVMPEPTEPARRDRDGFSWSEIEARTQKLAGWRQRAAERTGLEPGWLAPRQVLSAVAAIDAKSEGDFLQAADKLRNWRIDRFADEWIKQLNG